MKPRRVFRHCPRCASRGLIRVNYHSGEVFDVVICDCLAGQFWRNAGEAVVRERMQLSADQQVADWEDAGEMEPAANPRSADFVQAGQTAKRAKL